MSIKGRLDKLERLAGQEQDELERAVVRALPTDILQVIADGRKLTPEQLATVERAVASTGWNASQETKDAILCQL